MLFSPQVNVYYYQEADGTCPVREFLLAQPARVQAQAEARVRLLSERGNELRRPQAENLGGGIWELRWRTGKVQYRILYCFHGRGAALLLHGLIKEGRVPDAVIARAQRRRQLFLQNPTHHTKP